VETDATQEQQSQATNSNHLWQQATQIYYSTSHNCNLTFTEATVLKYRWFSCLQPNWSLAVFHKSRRSSFPWSTWLQMAVTSV